MNKGKKLIKGALTRNINFFLQIIISFFMMPFIIHSLGNRFYGFWILIGTFIGYYGLLDLGLSSSIQRYVSRALSQNDIKEMNCIISTSLVLFSVVGAIALLLSFLSAIFCSYFLNNPEEIILFREIIIILGISMAIGFPMRVFRGILSSYLRYDLSSYASISRLILANILIYFFLKAGYGILEIAIITFVASLLEYTMIFFFANKVFNQLQISYSLYRKDRIKLLFNYSKITFVAQIADILRFKVDYFVISAFLGVNLVTYYAIGARLISYFGEFIVSSIGVMAPVFSQYEGAGDYDSIRRIFLKVTKISIIMSVFLGTSIIFYSRVFIQRWMGPGFESSYYVVLILCVPAIIGLMQNPSIGLLYGISKHHYYAISNTCEGILNLILSIILVRYYGIYGVALGTAIEGFIFKLFIQPVFTCRAVKLSTFEYYIKTLCLTSFKSLIPLLLYFYITKDFLKPSYTSIVILGGIQILLFIPITFFWVLNKSEKQLILSFYKQTYQKTRNSFKR